MKIIKNIHQDIFGRTFGECEERKVQYTHSTEMWFFVDSGDYITDKFKIN